MHVNDPFIVLITDVNHRNLPPAAPTACSEPLVCMRDHMWYGGSFTPFYPSIIWLAIHILVHAYRAAARLRLQHDAGVTRTGYV